MASLKEIVHEVMATYGETTNQELYDRIKRLVLEYSAVAIRQDSARNGINEQYIISCPIDLVQVPISDLPDPIDNTMKVLRSVNRIPTPIRIQHSAPFFFVGNENGLDAYVHFGSFASAIRSKDNRYLGRRTKYIYHNRYLYIIREDNNLKRCIISTSFVNSHLIDTSNSTYTKMYVDDTDEFLLPEDLIVAVKAFIAKDMLKVTDNNVVEQNAEPKPTDS